VSCILSHGLDHLHGSRPLLSRSSGSPLSVCLIQRYLAYSDVRPPPDCAVGGAESIDAHLPLAHSPSLVHQASPLSLVFKISKHLPVRSALCTDVRHCMTWHADALANSCHAFVCLSTHRLQERSRSNQTGTSSRTGDDNISSPGWRFG